MRPNKSQLAKEWIDYWEEEARTGEFPDSFVSIDLDELARIDPEYCWDVILEILATIDPVPENNLVQVLAAGPLEDLLGAHGDIMIDRIETHAATDPAFNMLLGGVWKNQMSDSIWARVQACRGNTW